MDLGDSKNVHWNPTFQSLDSTLEMQGCTKFYGEWVDFVT